MSRHRGRSRPFTARRRIWPKHCGCPFLHFPEWDAAVFDLHVVQTVAPRIGVRFIELEVAPR